jgi:hypothetical protein
MQISLLHSRFIRLAACFESGIWFYDKPKISLSIIFAIRVLEEVLVRNTLVLGIQASYCNKRGKKEKCKPKLQVKRLDKEYVCGKLFSLRGLEGHTHKLVKSND